LITLHPNAESSSITWIEAQIKTFGALTHLNDTWVHAHYMTLYPLHLLGEFLSIAVQIPVLCLSLSRQLRGPPAQCLRALSTHELMDLQKLLKTGGVAVRLKLNDATTLTAVN
jgi:hypothetical protein